MKTAEQWQNVLGKFPEDQKSIEQVFSQAKIPEKLLPRVTFWNSVVTELDIEQIQLDAFKAGMEYAASMVRIQHIHSDFALGHKHGEELMAQKIRSAAELLPEIPKDLT